MPETAQLIDLPERIPRYSRLRSFHAIKIGQPKHQILQAVARFQYLTAKQLTRLLYSPGSLTHTQQHLMELFQAGYLNRVYLPHLSRFRGSPLAFYHLDAKGYRYLKQQGLAPQGRFRRTELEEASIEHLRHIASSSDLLILCHQLEKKDPRLTLHAYQTEKELKHRTVYVDVGSKRVGVVPDGWVDLRTTSHQVCIAFELDRGTVSKKDWRQRIAAYASYAAGSYQKEFETASLTIAVVTTKGQHRLQELLGWAEAELTRLGQQELADCLLYSPFDPGQVDPAAVFFWPIWHKPFSPEQVTLLADFLPR